jgi:hypothetical protein
MVVEGLGSNAVAAVKFSAGTYGEVDLTACMAALMESTERVNRGDLAAAEALLMAQAVTLNAMFANLILRARDSQYVESFDRYMRCGLRAQAQCRATLETLAAIKNPPTVFAKQANIANGPQQVNNTALVQEGSRVRALPGPLPNELLEGHVERMDAGAPAAAGGGDQALEAVGVFDRPTNRGR